MNRDDSAKQHVRLTGALANWSAFLGTLAVAFFLAPYLIARLGETTYGVWIFVEAILAWFTLLDLGIGVCVVRYTARHFTRGEFTELNRLLSCCAAVYAIVGGLILLLGCALTPLALTLLRTETPTGETGTFLLLMVVNLAVTMPLSIYPSILDGLEKFTAKSIVRVSILLTKTAVLIVVLENDGGLIGLGIVTTIANLTEHALFRVLVRRAYPALRMRRADIDRATLRTIKGYSLDAFLAMVAGRISWQTAPLLIGVFHPAALITRFAIAVRLVEIARSILRSVTTTLTPAISSWEAAGNRAAIRSILCDGTRWVLYLALPVQVGLYLFGEAFLLLWLKNPALVRDAVPALMILAGATAIGTAQSVAARVLYGIGELHLFARLALLEAFLNLATALLLVEYWGIVGIALALTIPNVLFGGFTLGYTCRSIDLSIGRYLLEGWGKPLLAVLLPTAIWCAMNGTIASWSDFVFAACLGGLPYLVLICLLEERIFDRIRRAMSRSGRVARKLRTAY